MRFSHITAAAFVLLYAVATAHAEKRVALVIGNDRYANLSGHEQLRKAVNDARAVGGALKQIGFEVISGENLGRQAMIDKLGEAAQRLSAGDMVFFFFAGHGIAVDGANYVLPADVPDVGKNQATRLKGAAIAEEYITTELTGAGAQVAVVVLDACRENPFGSGTRGIGGERGPAATGAAQRGLHDLFRQPWPGRAGQAVRRRQQSELRVHPRPGAGADTAGG